MDKVSVVNKVRSVSILFSCVVCVVFFFLGDRWAIAFSQRQVKSHMFFCQVSDYYVNNK